ncbi:hypothetical protein IAU60_003875 [Kwoniella sp. DSM 27419]
MSVDIAQPLQLPSSASLAAVQAAQTAAGSQHALINLIRLVKSLETKFVSEGDEEFADDYIVRRDWETVLYARALLEALQQGNEQTSKTASSLRGLSNSLQNVETAFKIRQSSPVPTPLANPAFIALPMTPTVSQPSSAISRVSSPPLAAPAIPAAPVTAPSVHPLQESASPNHSKVRNRRSRVDDYLAQRAKGDLGSEADLLPLKNAIQVGKTLDGVGTRERLLEGASARSGIGSAQLHEELGGQLAEMSHRLKLNAVHFARSLDNEKEILETSQQTLEKNLGATRSSKKHLSSVSSKGRGTTCLTLGVVVLVMVVFIWTYMLIRFT